MAVCDKNHRAESELIELARRLENFLRTHGYRAGNGIHAKELIKEAGKSKVKLSDTKLRQLMNYLRKNKRHVGSTTVDGYFYVQKSSDYKKAIQNLKSRARDLEEQIREMETAEKEMWESENALADSLRQHPITQLIKTEFKAVEVPV